MSGELYNVRKIMLRGTEMSKMDAEVLSNYDDKKTVLSSYLIKKMIAQSAAKGTEFDNSITSEQEMWQIKLTEKQEITKFSIFEQEEGVKIQPILLASSANVLDIGPFTYVAIETAIITHTDYKATTLDKWSFNDVKDFYESVYPHQFGSEGEVKKLGLAVVDFSEMNLQELSEIHIPKLIKVEVPNDQNFYDSVWFIPVAMKTPVINKSILIDAPSVLVINPVSQDEDGEEYYSYDTLGVSNQVSSEDAGQPRVYDETGAVSSLSPTAPITVDTITYPPEATNNYTTIRVDTESEPTPIITLEGESVSSITVSKVVYTVVGSTDVKSFEIKTIEAKFVESETGEKVTTNKGFAPNVIVSPTVPAGYDWIDVDVTTNPDSPVIEIVKSGSLDKISVSKVVYKLTEGGDNQSFEIKPETVSLLIDVNVRVSQFACGASQLEASVPAKLSVETVSYCSNPSAFHAVNGAKTYACAYCDGVVKSSFTLPIPAYYQTVALEKLETLEWVTPAQKEIMYNKACVIVPKDSEISVDYTQMYGTTCDFNILVLEPKYLFKMTGTLSKPVDRHRYLNMEDYLMELPYRHYNNMLMDSLFCRSYENFDQTYKLVVEKDASKMTFNYVDGVVPLAVTDSRTAGKTAVDKYLLATKLVDENQKVYTLDTSKRLSIGVEDIDHQVKISVTDVSKGFDVYGFKYDTEVEIEVPIIDLGANVVFLDGDNEAPAGMLKLGSDNLKIHVNNFINDYDPEHPESDVTVVTYEEGGETKYKITAVPTHVKSQTSGQRPGAIPATIVIDEAAIGPDVKTADVREAMIEDTVASPITLYTLGEAGWAEDGTYVNKNPESEITLIKFFARVLVPKAGLAGYKDDDEDIKADWRKAFARMLRLPDYTEDTIDFY